MVARRLLASACFALAVAAVVGAVILFDTGLAGPAPIALAAAGGLIVIGVTLWQPPKPVIRYPPLDRRDGRPPRE